MVHITPITLWGRGHQQNHPLGFRCGFFFFFMCHSVLLSSLSSKALSAVSCDLKAYPGTAQAEMVWVVCMWLKWKGGKTCERKQKHRVCGLFRLKPIYDPDHHSPSLRSCVYISPPPHISFPCVVSLLRPADIWAVGCYPHDVTSLLKADLMFPQ